MRWLAVFFLTGCSSILGIEDFQVGDGGTPGDGRDAMEVGYCLGPMPYRICVMNEPTNTISFNVAAQLDTNSNPQCLGMQPSPWKPSQPDACIVVAKTITISADVQWVGSRPLVLFASDSITVGATLDVASHSASGGSVTMTRGAGSSATSPACMPAAGVGQTNATSAGGGAGGSFITKGGDGGNSTAGAMGGRSAAAAAQAPTVLRGGCDGAVGGNSNGSGGIAGMGGGAVYLVAGNRITINDTINASGSGGGGAGNLAGGGGAGSGGMILLHAAAIGGSGGVLVANGGAGGGGGANGGGLSGADPVPDMPALTPIGGTGGNGGGGNGGNGFAGGTNATNGNNGTAGASGGGGGGGGAGGYIRANMAVSIAASPSVSVVP